MAMMSGIRTRSFMLPMYMGSKADHPSMMMMKGDEYHQQYNQDGQQYGILGPSMFHTAKIGTYPCNPVANCRENS